MGMVLKVENVLTSEYFFTNNLKVVVFPEPIPPSIRTNFLPKRTLSNFSLMKRLELFLFFKLKF